MPESWIEPPYKPPLRPHRLVPAFPTEEQAEATTLEGTGQDITNWSAETGVAVWPEMAAGGRVLSEQAWHVIEKAALTIDALTTLMKGPTGASGETLKLLQLMSATLLALPDQLAAGVEASISRVDWMFARLLNAPLHSGLIQQLMDALVVPAGQEMPADQTGVALAAAPNPETPPADYTAEIGVLRGLHRDLVTLQQRWDELVERAFPLVPPSSADQPPPGDPEEASAETTGEMPAVGGAPKAPTPLPEGLVVAQPAVGGPPRLRPALRQRQRLALVMALLLFFITSAGVILARVQMPPAINPGNAAFSVGQRTRAAPIPTSASQPTIPTPVAATPTPRPPAPTHQPLKPRPSTTPTPPGPICPAGAAFCVSTLQLQVPCAGQGSVTFQLTNTMQSKQNWMAASSLGPGGAALVSVSPAHGKLSPNQAITLTVQTSVQGQNRSGTITLIGPFGTTPITITLTVCG